uniref:Uncharacterized protein n=1 Tax=Palpitomonas bilix TaxID=652834 RepID=A0A7S3GC16_9EUKA|mmetsp:Transcript_39802/g.102519  ORF Transcript_39802/g.102519 Transcript_39802/m.102519 type:complete len:195 (+) Transcript_39802:1899-2483(+)
MGTEGFETFYGERSPSDRTYTKSPPSSFKNRNFFNSFSKFLCYKQEKQINSCTYIWLGFFQTFAFLLPSLPSLPFFAYFVLHLHCSNEVLYYARMQCQSGRASTPFSHTYTITCMRTARVRKQNVDGPHSNKEGRGMEAVTHMRREVGEGGKERGEWASQQKRERGREGEREREREKGVETYKSLSCLLTFSSE